VATSSGYSRRLWARVLTGIRCTGCCSEKPKLAKC
jgi:hypothetical protein